MDSEDRSEPPAAAVTPTAAPSRTGAPWPIVAVLALVCGAAIGLLVGLLVADDDGESAAEQTTRADCEQARAIVSGAGDEMAALSDTDVQDATFFSAMIVQQRSVTYAMDDAPTCFTLQDRAAANGLLAGLEGLLLNSDPGAVNLEATVDPPAEVDDDDAGGDETQE